MSVLTDQPAARQADGIRVARLLAGYGAVGFASVYIALKVAWVAGSRIGVGDDAEMTSPEMISANVVTGGLALVGVVVALAFTYPWGRRIPAWLILVPTWVGTGLLAPIALGMTLLAAVAAVGLVDWPASDGGELHDWVGPVVYTSFTGLGICLAAAYVLYARERWPELFRGTAKDGPAQTTRSVQTPLAWLAASLAAGLALTRLNWAFGGTAGLDGDNLDERNFMWHAMHAIYALLAIGAAVGLLTMVRRAGRRPFWQPLAATWVGAGSMFAWGLIWVLLFGTLADENGIWDLAEAQVAYDLVNTLSVVAGMLIGVVALFHLSERRTLTRTPG